MERSREAFVIGGHSIAPGSAETIDLPVVGLYTRAPVSMPVRVLHGRREGPVVFVSAALHGDAASARGTIGGVDGECETFAHGQKP